MTQSIGDFSASKRDQNLIEDLQTATEVTYNLNTNFNTLFRGRLVATGVKRESDYRYPSIQADWNYRIWQEERSTDPSTYIYYAECWTRVEYEHFDFVYPIMRINYGNTERQLTDYWWNTYCPPSCRFQGYYGGNGDDDFYEDSGLTEMMAALDNCFYRDIPSGKWYRCINLGDNTHTYDLYTDPVGNVYNPSRICEMRFPTFTQGQTGFTFVEPPEIRVNITADVDAQHPIESPYTAPFRWSRVMGENAETTTTKTGAFRPMTNIYVGHYANVDGFVAESQIPDKTELPFIMTFHAIGRCILNE